MSSSDNQQPALSTTTTRRDVLRIGAGGLAAVTLGGALSACGEDGGPLPPASVPPSAAPLPPLPTATFDSSRAILSQPMLQNPGIDSVRVVWFSEIEGGVHSVRYGPNLTLSATATTTRMSHMLEDNGSPVFERNTASLTTPQARAVYRHEAVVTNVVAGGRVPYVAVSEGGGTAVRSPEYTLQALPGDGQPVKILLTSDQQNNRMAAANFQKVQETIGPVDAVLFAGDFVSQPNRASEWFDRNQANNPSFFQSLQGRHQRWVPAAPFKGGEVLQHAPLYGCLGNHEYPGRWRMDPTTNNPNNTTAVSINNMDNDPQPRWYAEQRYEELKAQINPTNDATFRTRWIEDNSFEWTTYREMWSLPEGPDGKAYYGQRFGDTFIISLDVNRIWRTPSANQRGKFTEQVVTATNRVSTNPDDWGFGDFTFRPFGRGSRQHDWLQAVLRSPAASTARYRIVVAHQTMAGLGDNAVPVHAEIRATVELIDGRRIGPFLASEWPQRWSEIKPLLAANQVRYVRYEYPLSADTWLTDIEPLLLQNAVQLVHTGHSHLWNRTRVGGLHYLETANVGNSFGAMFFPTAQAGVSATQGPRSFQPGNAGWRDATVLATTPRTTLEWNPADYPAFGDPHGRPMAMPTIFNPMREMEGRPQDLPFIASNNLTAFSVFENTAGVVSSYVYDTRVPNGPVRKFDEFSLI